ncbi:bifunctional 3-(3-hydroxy-phenyl)propionate/3-hydroxycinnamic acid hydroxylase [Streptomyces sp. NPDC006638]|uniref:bifunctional 3-(3-hydroxy-phenyl)propionate/3-hydroxycinnamic acid hydroxylase MhpA n=1 Tax=Streptomyces sp. NPDC006638 TaxID=3157183 RepID=UPI0033AA85B9
MSLNEPRTAGESTDDVASKVPVLADGVPVVIVGAGPVGVTAALLLARHGVRSVLLERHTAVYPLPRAVATDDEVRRILQAAGVEAEFASIARSANGLRLLDARHRVIAEFPRTAEGPHGFPETSMFDQPELEGLLRAALARSAACELREGVEVLDVTQEGDGPAQVSYRAAGGDGEVHSLRASAVLGCDGANSLVRRAMGARWEDLRFEEEWTAIDVRTSAPVRTWGGVDQVCDPHRPATFMRIGEDRYRWEFRLGRDEGLDGEQGRERLRRLVAPWIDLATAGDFEIRRQARYTFRARIADRWRRGRLFVLGDAAHLTPPFVGQGLCAGLRDAHNLAWKLARVLNEGADDALLDTYQLERKPHARHVIRLAVATGWAMTGGQDAAAAARRALVGAAARVPGLAKAAGRDLSPALAPGPLIHPRTRVPGRRRELAGTHCPQPWVRFKGRRVRLDDVLGTSWAVLTATPLSPAAHAVAQGMGARVVHVQDTGDAAAVLAAWLRGGGADAALVRPDRVVLDTVAAGGDGFAHSRRWARLLCTTRRPEPSARHAGAQDSASAPLIPLIPAP